MRIKNWVLVNLILVNQCEQKQAINLNPTSITCIFNGIIRQWKVSYWGSEANGMNSDIDKFWNGINPNFW